MRVHLFVSLSLVVLATISDSVTGYAQETANPKTLSNLPNINGIKFEAYEEAIKATEEGDRLVSKSNTVQAIKCYLYALQRAEYSEALISLGRAYIVAGDYTNAVATYRVLFKKVDKTWTERRVQIPFAIALAKTGHYDEAWEHYQYGSSVEESWILPKPPAITREQVPTGQFAFAANLTVAATLIDRDNAQAGSFARAAIKANPTSGLPYYYLGQTLQSTDLAGAKAAYEKAVHYGHGEVAEKAKRELDYVSVQLAKQQAAKPAVITTVPTP